MSNIRIEGILAQQERKRRLEREKKQNQPAVKAKREASARESADSMRLFTAHMDAENADGREPPLYEVVLDHIDIADPKFSKLRARIVVSAKLTIAQAEYGMGTWRWAKGEPERRLARAKEILALLEGEPR